jgi:apolipoprotein N-acyltransferase
VLVPFFEYLPLEQRSTLPRRWFPQTLDYRPGPDNQPLALNNHYSLATPICYEILFNHLFVNDQFDIIINEVMTAGLPPIAEARSAI